MAAFYVIHTPYDVIRSCGGPQRKHIGRTFCTPSVVCHSLKLRTRADSAESSPPLVPKKNKKKKAVKKQFNSIKLMAIYWYYIRVNNASFVENLTIIFKL